MTEQETMTAPLDAELRQRAVDSICSLVPRVLKQEVPALSEGTKLMDFNMTSGQTLELMLEIEDELDVQVDVEEFDDSDADTVGALANFIARHALANG